MVKANAYGHGAVAISSYLEKEGIDWLGVALTEEAIELRQAGIKSPILCLGGFWQTAQAYDCFNYGLTPTVYRLDMVDTLASVAAITQQEIKFHLKIDTGMGRLGIAVKELSPLLARVADTPYLILDGVMTHLASADEPAKAEFTLQQLKLFQDCLASIKGAGFHPTYRHIANSPATCAWPAAHGNMVRVGGLLYGLWRDVTAPNANVPSLSPALSLYTRIILLKEVAAGMALGYGGTFSTSRKSLIATLPIGYRDGLRRNYSNVGQVLIRGQYAPIVGRVSMDLTLVDVTDVRGVALGDEVVLIGTSQARLIGAEDMAAWIDTISYEVTCALSERVPRFYLDTYSPRPVF